MVLIVEIKIGSVFMEMGMLKGSGHFSIGFMIGFLFFLIIHNIWKKKNIAVWGPFIPFLFGIIASFPYLFVLFGEENRHLSGQLSNLFLFYDFFHHNEFAILVMNKFAVSIFSIAILYCALIIYYIRAIKNLLRNAK